MPPRSNTNIKLAVWVLVIIGIILTSSKIFKGPFKDFKFDFTSEFSYAFRSELLSTIVQNNLAGKSGEYSVYIEELSGDNPEIYTLNSQNIYPSASLYKLFLMAAVLKEVEEGKLKMEDEVSASTSYLISVLGSTDYGYEGAPSSVAYNVEEALIRVGRISDNFASIMLAEKISWEKLQAVADSLGATSTTIEDPITTTSSDIALFFRKLHKKEVVSVQTSEKIIEFLSLNQLNDRIPARIAPQSDAGGPAKLPEGVKSVHEQSSGLEPRVVHKTGELARLRHDAGIVYLPEEKGAYLIVLMSQNLQHEDEAIETMAQISKEVYEYFNSK